MSERILLMPDKIVRGGSSPVYDQNNQAIATIHYQYFSMTNKIEIYDQNNQVISRGKTKMFSFRPTWIIMNQNEEEIGIIKEQIAFFARKYVYTNLQGKELRIEGNLRGRNFQFYKGEQLVISVSSVSEFFTFRPHSFEVRILDESMPTFEAINLVEGIRSLVELTDD